MITNVLLLFLNAFLVRQPKCSYKLCSNKRTLLRIYVALYILYILLLKRLKHSDSFTGWFLDNRKQVNKIELKPWLPGLFYEARYYLLEKTIYVYSSKKKIKSRHFSKISWKFHVWQYFHLILYLLERLMWYFKSGFYEFKGLSAKKLFFGSKLIVWTTIFQTSVDPFLKRGDLIKKKASD